jgi:hypothetical protein
MIVALLLAGTPVDPSSHLVGDWSCGTLFPDDPPTLDLGVRVLKGKTAAEISNSRDQRLPNGQIRIAGPAEVIQKPYEWQKKSQLIADVQQNFFVKNSVGDVDFVMLWDKDDGVSVNLWQYFNDRSPSQGLGGLICKAKPQ